ncbi:MAG: patatin-like phospholipase family protein [Agarilytica sp.]
MKAFGLALGGGGVKGLAHIALLKKLDEIGAKPEAISGTSMGAIIGALYAHGLSGTDIEERVRAHLFSRKESIKETYRRRKHLVKWLKVFKFDKERGGFITADGLFEHLFSELLDCDFSELEIPFTAVAADFNTAEEVTLNRGQVLPAVQASMAVPGVFSPVILNNRLLVDGGVVNNVPCSHIAQPERLTIASDVISLSEVKKPKATEVVSGAFSIMMRAATEQRFSQHPPDFVFRPDTKKIDAFDFHKIAKVLERGDAAIERTSPQLELLLR